MQLASWQTACGLPAALSWLWNEPPLTDYQEFIRRHPTGSAGEQAALLICAYFETVGTLHRHGLLNESLLFDWLEIGPLWDRLKPYILGRRHVAASPTLWSNFEALAVAYKRLTREYST